MQRTKTIQKADAILTSDWHLREVTDTPICRTDDFQVAQWEKVDFVSALQKKHDCPVLFGGDLFEHWKPSPWLLSKTMEHLPDQFKAIYGNHCLPQHSISLQDKSGVFALRTALALEILPGTHWGHLPKEESLEIKGKKILVYHVMTYQGKKPWPGCTDPMGAKLLRQYPEYDLILTGHNHKAFIEHYGHKGSRYTTIVNPGSLMRQEAGQIDFRPRVYLYYADTNSVEPVYLPIEQGVVTRGHIEEQEERDGRIDSFISKLETDWEAGVVFQDNLEQFFQTNKIENEVKEIVQKSLEI